MFKFLKNNLITTNDCIILATPMILYITVLQWYLVTFQYTLNTAFQYTLFFITLWIWISGCCAGWFYMLKKTLQFSKKTYLYDLDRISAIKKLFTCLYKGIGKFFLPFLLLVILYFLFKVIKISLMFYVYGLVNSEVYDYVSAGFILIILLFAYWFIFLIPEIIYNYVNPFKAVINSVKKSYIAFKKCFPIYFILCISGFVLNLFLLNSLSYPILYFILLILSYYFVLYSILAVFKLYEKNFIE